ncbi:hypothetical protein [Clostridium nigeriense]|uniref:hypothetical protein n=1 Tax=Clostridium nigeriense TaxID=1805470 RepID=UPI00082EFE75|nr:hypothetical protein [Clostridium nigeriense]
MKSIIYKNRIIFSIVLFLLTMALVTYLYNNNLIYLNWWIITLFIVLNRKILCNIGDLHKKEKTILVVSLILITIVFMFFFYTIAINKVINK